MCERINKLFNAMKNDMNVMAEYGDDEEMLKLELSTCGEEVLREYEKTYVKENNNMNEKEYIIAKVKELGITKDELGFQNFDKEYLEMELRRLTESCRQELAEKGSLIVALRELIENCDIDPETAREYVPEEYWDEVHIGEKKYKVVKVTVQKTISKDIYVAMPEDADTCVVDEYIGNLDNLDNDYLDDETDWEIDDWDVDEDNLTKDEVEERGQDEIWNYDDFDEE